MDFTGTAGDDVLKGTSTEDTFSVDQGGEDKVLAFAGNDIISMGATLDAGDRIDGGDNYDTVRLDGDINVVFQAKTMINVERLELTGGHNYAFVTNDQTVAAGQSLEVYWTSSKGSNALSFDGSAETDGTFILHTGSGAGDDVLTGGANGDTFYLNGAGKDTVKGLGGDDTLHFAGSFTAADKIDGGDGYDTLYLSGGASVTMHAATMTGIENLQLASNFSYTIVTADETVAAGQHLFVDGGYLSETNSLVFDGSAETDGAFTVSGGFGDDILTGGAGDDTLIGEGLTRPGPSTNILNGGGGNDYLIGGIGNNTLNGGDGDDVIESHGVGKIDGGAGFDSLTLDRIDSTADIVVDASHPNHTTHSSDGTTITGFEVVAVYAGSGDDTLTGGAGNDTLEGGTGDNVLSGGDGDDLLVTGSFVSPSDGGTNTILGGAGNDQITALAGHIDLEGGDGDDTIVTGGTGQIDGGAGEDTVTLQFADPNAAFHFQQTSATSATVDNGTTIVNVEHFDVQGSGGNDVIEMLGGDDQVGAGAGDDVVRGGDGDDYLHNGESGALYGESGNDRLVSGTGNTTLNGGSGDDLLESNGHDKVIGGDGNDTLTLHLSAVTGDLTFKVQDTSSVSTVIGEGTTVTGVERFYITGGSGNDTITTGNGDDQISGGAGNNTLDGGGGNDYLSEQNQSGRNVLFGGTGNDLLTGGSGINKLFGDSGDDTITSTGSADAIHGGSGNDHITVFANGTAHGDAGDDSISLIGHGLADGGSGIDSVTINSFSSMDLVFNETALSTLTTLVGDGASVVNVENIQLTGGSGNDTFKTLGGNDNLAGGAGDDLLNGGGGDDTLDGGTGNNTLKGGGGNDYIIAGFNSGIDTIDGGAGKDTVNIIRLDTPDVTFAPVNTSAVTTLDDGTTIVNVENFRFASGAGDDHLTGLGGDDRLSSSGGDDVLTGAGGNDILTSGLGHSVLSGGTGDDLIFTGGVDTVDGGKGEDTLYYYDPISVVFHANAASGVTTLQNGTTVTHVENFWISGGIGDDVLTGGDGIDMLDGGLAGNNTIDGGAGDDWLTDYGGNNTFIGGTGEDTVEFSTVSNFSGATANLQTGAAVSADGGIDSLTGVEDIIGTNANDVFTGDAAANKFNGEDGNDTLKGGGGADILIGSYGADMLDGGAGADTFAYTIAQESDGVGFDTVAGFNTAEDIFALPVAVHAIDTAVTGGHSGRASLDADLTTALQAAELHAHHAVLFTGSSGNLAGQLFLVVDGNGVAGYQSGMDYVIALNGLDGALTTANFAKDVIT